MRYTISSLGRRAAALALAALMLIPPVFASAAGEAKLTTKRAVTQGLTYINTISQHPSTGRTESYALELDPDSQVQAIMLQSSGTIYASSTINGAIKQAQQQGWRVLGAMNTDYFSTATGVPSSSVMSVWKKQLRRPSLSSRVSAVRTLPRTADKKLIWLTAVTVRMPVLLAATAKAKSARVNSTPPITCPAALRWQGVRLSVHLA